MTHLRQKPKRYAEQYLEDIEFLIEYANKKGKKDLAARLKYIFEFINNLTIGEIQNNTYLLAFLKELVEYSKFYLLLEDQSIKSMEESEEYWLTKLFPNWVTQEDSRLNIWLEKLITEAEQGHDDEYLTTIAQIIKKKQGISVFYSLIADYSMVTDLIISDAQKNVCVQITQTNPEKCNESNYEGKITDWEKCLKYWKIQKGVFLIFSISNRQKWLYNNIVNGLLTTFKTGINPNKFFAEHKRIVVK